MSVHAHRNHTDKCNPLSLSPTGARVVHRGVGSQRGEWKEAWPPDTRGGPYAQEESVLTHNDSRLESRESRKHWRGKRLRLHESAISRIGPSGNPARNSDPCGPCWWNNVLAATNWSKFWSFFLHQWKSSMAYRLL